MARATRTFKIRPATHDDLKAIVGVITNGVPDTGMNPFKDQLSAAEIQALAKYVRSLDKNLKR